jgi:thiol-disulfide isomerase/thioredoxin
MALGCALVAGMAVAAGDGPWVTNWADAKAQAAKEKKLLLIDFSGSDWCGWCMKLDKEVFSKKDFLAEAKKKYVMVLLDFPRDKSGQSEELQKQNDKLQEEFQVEGFPSVFLAKADGTPIAKTGYRPGGPKVYLGHLEELVSQHKEVAKLEAMLPGTKGAERAKLLDEICTKMTMDTPQKAKYMGEIIKLDADNKAGLKEKYLMSATMTAMMGGMRSGKFKEAEAACDKALSWKGLSAEKRQYLMVMKSQVAMTAGDKKRAKALLLEAKDVDPKGKLAAKIDEILKGQWFKDVE